MTSSFDAARLCVQCPSELQHANMLTGQRHSDEDVRNVMTRFDKDGSGDLNLDEFKALAQVEAL